MKQAQVEGWKLKIRYHEVWGFVNVLNNRGETDYFVDDVTVLDKDFANPLKRVGNGERGRKVTSLCNLGCRESSSLMSQSLACILWQSRN